METRPVKQEAVTADGRWFLNTYKPGCDTCYTILLSYVVAVTLAFCPR